MAHQARAKKPDVREEVLQVVEDVRVGHSHIDPVTGSPMRSGERAGSPNLLGVGVVNATEPESSRFKHGGYSGCPQPQCAAGMSGLD